MCQVDRAITHFATNYGETLNMKSTVDFAPKYDYNILEKENKELRKQHEPLTAQLKRDKAHLKLVYSKFNRLQANATYTKDMKKRYEIKLEELRSEFKDLQFYSNDLEEVLQRESITKENNLLIFKRIVNKASNSSSLSTAEKNRIEKLMQEFIEVS